MKRRVIPFVVAGVGALAAAAVGSGGTSAGAACSISGWPAVSQGAPVALHGSAAGYFVWRHGQTWHVRAKAGAAMPTFMGRVAAKGKLTLLSTAASAGVTAAGPVINFRFSNLPGMQGFDFNAPCASRLGFQLTVPGQAAKPVVYLGVRSHAPAGSFDVTRQGSTGVAGQILLGPLCPILPCGAQAKPAQGTVQISTAPTSKSSGSSGQVVATVTTSATGDFSATLAPGHYVATVVQSSSSAKSKPVVFDVEAGVVTRIVLPLDTGIRAPSP
jgi:hypothetical protein